MASFHRPPPVVAGRHWESWTSIANTSMRRRDRSVTEVQTGYQEETLDNLWSSAAPYFMQVLDTYTGRKKLRERSVWRAQHHFYILLMYIHLYPARDNMIDTLKTSKITQGVSDTVFYKQVLPCAREWAMNIDEIHWDERLAHDNHHPFFPYLATVIWDTTCYPVQKPTDWGLGRYVVNGHYDFPCFLVLTGITFTGHLVYFSGLHRSTSYDANIFEDTRYLHPQFPWEMNIGDGHFATVRNFFTPAQRIGGRQLSPLEMVWNEYLQLVRSRVEHLNTVLKRHHMFQIPYRGYMCNLATFIKISGHGTAAELRVRGDRYEGYGNWAHY